MITKDYLNQLEMLDRKIKNKLSEIEQLRTMATSVTSNPKDVNVQSSGSYDKMGDAVAKIVDLENEVSDVIDLYIAKRKRIIEQIDEMTDVNLYHVLHERYVMRKTWAVIEYEMGYEHITVMKMHGKALQVFEEMWGSEYLE